MKILITGTTGWLGSELAKRLASSNTNNEHEIVGLSRRPTFIPGVRSIEADITSPTDMNRLKKSEEPPFDVIIHLAGAAGWCSLEQALEINVSGTQRLIDATRQSSCQQKYIIASSVAVTGTCAPHHPPEKLPIGPEHGFVGSTWAYGYSKDAVERLVKFMSVKDPEADYILLRIGGVVTDPPAPLIHKETAIGEDVIIEPATATPPIDPKKEVILPEMPLLAIALSDMTQCFHLAVKAPYKKGVRVITAVGPSVYSRDSVVDVMTAIYGAETVQGIDMAFHRIPGNEFKPIYETETALKELGFEAVIDLRKECGLI